VDIIIELVQYLGILEQLSLAHVRPSLSLNCLIGTLILSSSHAALHFERLGSTLSGLHIGIPHPVDWRLSCRRSG